MTSVVDTSVKHFHNLMAGAPVLSGTVGAMIGVLDACLINGFDVKTGTSLVVAAGVATLSFTGSHSATVDSVILVSGVTDITALNGEQKITAIGAGFVKFATAAANGTVAGTISFKMAPAGWAKVFTGTNLAVYQSADSAGMGMYLRVDDTGTTFIRVVGYESMTDVNTGVGAFPSAAQMSGGGYWIKSSVASAAAIPWVLFSDSRKFIFHNQSHFPSSTLYLGGSTRGFGDDLALRPGGDPYACSLNYSGSTNGVVQASEALLDGSTQSLHAMPRPFTGLGSSTLHAIAAYNGTNNYSGLDGFLGAFPGPVDGGLRLSKRFFRDATSTAPRSDLPGLFHVPHSLVFDTFKTRDLVSGTGPLAGRRLMAVNPHFSGNSTGSGGIGVSFIDITGPWR